MKQIPFLLILCLTFLIQLPQSYAQFKKPEEKANRLLQKATEAFEDLTTMGEDKSIPQQLLNQAEGIVIFPKALKVALVAGGQGGGGFAFIKKENGEWSNPYFLDMGEASVGAQIGVQATELILLFKKRENILGLEKADFTLGGDVGVAVGPLGRNSSVNTDIGFEAEIYSYSKSKGLYAGISIEGNVLKANEKVNKAFYGKSKGIQEIFYKLDTPFNAKVAKFLQAVQNSL